MSLFKNKYRIEPARLDDFNYSSSGAYFITICTRKHFHFFGKIINDEMHLYEMGLCAHKEWLKTPEIRKDINISLDEFVVMPNHFHGIIHIGKNQYNTDNLETKNGAYKETFQPQRKNLSSIIRGYKSAVTAYARKKHIPFAWQSRFYDHIIRNDEELNRVRKYLKQNPGNWYKDGYHF